MPVAVGDLDLPCEYSVRVFVCVVLSLQPRAFECIVFRLGPPSVFSVLQNPHLDASASPTACVQWSHRDSRVLGTMAQDGQVCVWRVDMKQRVMGFKL